MAEVEMKERYVMTLDNNLSTRAKSLAKGLAIVDFVGRLGFGVSRASSSLENT